MILNGFLNLSGTSRNIPAQHPSLPAFKPPTPPFGAKSPAHTAGDDQRLGGREVAARDCRAQPAQQKLKFLGGPHRRQVDAETLGGIDWPARQRQQLLREATEQIGLAVEQRFEGARLGRTRGEIEQTALGVGDARRAAARVAGMALGEAPSRIARERRKKIRIK
jgi:hypothetical protein